MTHQVDALGSQADGQRFIPRSHMVEGKNQLLQYVLSPPHKIIACMSLYTLTQMNKFVLNH